MAYDRRRPRNGVTMGYPPKYCRQTILQLARQGLDDRQVAILVGCSPSLVSDYRNKYSIPSNGRNRKWTEEEDNKLRELYKQGKKRVDIAKELNRSLSEIMHRAERLGISYKYDNYHGRMRQRDIIWRMIERGYPTKTITRRMKITESTYYRIKKVMPSCFQKPKRKSSLQSAKKTI